MRYYLIFIPFLVLSCKKDDTTPPMGGELSIPIYNHAYAENYEPDQIDFILTNAENAYVLVDPYEAGVPDQISAIKVKNNEVGGYMSIGTGENWRSDFSDLEPFLVEKEWGEWKGEYFVSEVTTGIVELMKLRIDQLAEWGCDWVEFDNMDWIYDDKLRDEYDIKATQEEGIAYYNELCDYVHEKGMRCMAKNTVHEALNFDGVLYESFHNELDWWEHDEADAFIASGKLVIINHYNEKFPNKTYAHYVSLYSNNISFISEDKKLKRYVHYNQ